MRKLFIFSLAMLVGPLLILGILWSQKDAIVDFWSDTQRMTAAPTPQSFSEVVENNTAAEDVGDAEDAETVEGEENEAPEETSSETPSEPGESEGSIPSMFNLAVPFTSQAPLANWDVVHEDTCEEAVLYMVNAFYEGWSAGKIDPNKAEADLLKIVEFEKALFGFFESTTAIQIAVLAEQMYGYEHVEVVENPTVEDLKAHLVAGRPVIVPSAGRMLGNPNFTGEGPLYHALVLKGYTETTFVTNDPGTRLGADYQYDFDTVMNAMHDWNGGEVESGRKLVVVVYPNE